MDNLLNYHFKKEKSAKSLLEDNKNYKNHKHNQVIEGMIKNDPLFDLINQHKKRLQEIKEWQVNMVGDTTQSEMTIIDTDKNNKLQQNLNSINIEQRAIKIEESKIDNNIKLAKDFLKLNSINKNQSSIAIDNTCTNNNINNDDSSININMNNTNNNIINENNNNNANDINQNDNEKNNDNNSNDNNSFSALKDSLRNDIDVNVNDDNNNFMNIIEQKYMKTGINFNKKLALDNIRNVDIKNYKSNNTNNKKNRHYSGRLTNYNITNCTNNDNIKSLEFRLEKKQIKIKNLEATIDLLTKENNTLKLYINELETKIENFHLINNNKNNILTQDNYIIQKKEMIDKINSLTKEIKEKNEIIEKMKNLEKLKIQDLQVLNQRCRDLEILSNENKTYIHNTEQIMFTINYFIKKIYNFVPILANNECFQEVKEPSELQKHLIAIENFISEYIIYNSNKKSQFLMDFENQNRNKNNPTFIDLKKEREREELEKKINEINEKNIFLIKEMSNKKKVKKKKSNNNSKGKKVINRGNNKYKK